jgi:type II secretory pathway component PulF
VRKIEAGSTLSDALAERPREFPRLVQALVRAGESTGQLDRILLDLVKHLEWREDLRRQVKSAATYPLIVVLGVVGLLVIVMGYVLPAFLEIFLDLGVALPLSTRALIALQGFLSQWWAALLGGSAALAIAAFAAGRTAQGRRQLHAAILRAPLFGRLVLMVEASRFAHNLGVLYAAGLPIMASLEMVRGIVQNQRVAEVVEDVGERVARGEGLADALGRHELMPAIVLRMVSIGEASGKLDEALERAATYYDREVPEIIARALALFNTGALFFLGGTIVVVVLSIFVPLYSMLGSLNG